MKAKSSETDCTCEWKELYKAALFEDDNTKIPQRILETEIALAARALELSTSGGDQVREQQAMENARYFLQVLRNTLAPAIAMTQNEPKKTAYRPVGWTESLFVPDREQDLHTARSVRTFCNE